jgi:ADP-heptose:LPS heptosyltransferase
MKIVLISHSGIGNLIHTTPCLKALRSKYEEAEITLLTWPRAARILEEWSTVNVSCEHPATFCQRERPDIVLLAPTGAIWHPSWDHVAHQVLRVAPGKKWIKHEVEYLMDFAYQLGYKGQIPEPQIHLDRTNHVVALTTMDRLGLRMKKFICLNIGYLKTEHWPLKHWGNDEYTILISELSNNKEWAKYEVVLVGSKEDKADGDKIIEGLNNELLGDYDHNLWKNSLPRNLCGAFNDIKDTAALINMSKLVVGNDGGLMHVASALQVPTVTIFTFTNPIKNKPFYTDKSLGRIVMVPCEDRISCQHGQWQKCDQKGCLNVPVKEVFDVIRSIN